MNNSGKPIQKLRKGIIWELKSNKKWKTWNYKWNLNQLYQIIKKNKLIRKQKTFLIMKLRTQIQFKHKKMKQTKSYSK